MRHVFGLRIDFFERNGTGAVLARFDAFRVVRDVVGNQGLAALLDAPLLLLSLLAIAESS